MQKAWSNMIYLVLILPVVLCISRALFNIYWHPLSRFPGPRSNAASRLPYAFCHVTGKLAVTFHALHEKYGPIVRTAPNELSFIEPEALKAIYSERQKVKPVFPKNYDTFKETRNQIAHSVFIAGDDDHRRMRKALNHAFSERNLQEQEARIQSHVDELIRGIRAEQNEKSVVVDLNERYNCVAFDVIADIVFGEPFSTLKESTYRSWLYLIGRTWKVITFNSALKSIVPALCVVRRLIPTGAMLQKEVNKFNLVLERVKKRMILGTSRGDLLTKIMKYNDENNSMTNQEIISNGTLFVAAGTETVATLLSALTYLLTRNKEPMKKLTDEIRGTFSDEGMISVQSVGKLQYLTACIQEGLRVFPPLPEGLPRVVPPEGENICGHWVPGGTFVQISNLAANLSPTNFVEPESFLPERWLGTGTRFLKDKKQASQPFSIGPRNCIGQSVAMAEARLVIARIVWRFDLKCHLQDDWMNQPSYLLWEKKPLPIELTSIR